MTTVTKMITKLKPVALGFSTFVILGLTGCGSTSKDTYYNALKPDQIFQEGVAHLNKRDFKAAVEDFEALEARYPFGAYGDKAQLGEIYGFFKTREYASVMAGADRFIRVYPTHPHLDYVLYMRGLASVADLHGSMTRLPMERNERDLENAELAINDFSRLIKRYPNSQYAADAGQHIIYLRNLLAEHELVASQYYFKRGAYLASANRAGEIIEHYDQSPVIKDALVMMIKSYRKLALDDLANDSLVILRTNFPNDPVIAELS